MTDAKVKLNLTSKFMPKSPCTAVYGRMMACMGDVVHYETWITPVPQFVAPWRIMRIAKSMVKGRGGYITVDESWYIGNFLPSTV